MVDSQKRISASRIVVVMPNWLGDAVMATPFLRALRGLYPEAHISALARPLVSPVLAGLGVGEDDSNQTTKTPRHQGWIDEVKVYEKGQEGEVVKWLRGAQVDLGILLPNSFRSAWMLWRGSVKRRLGYARDRRSWLLTDRLKPIERTAEQQTLDLQKAAAIKTAGGENVRVRSRYQPWPTINYYLELALHLSAPKTTGNRPMCVNNEAQQMELGILDSERAEAAAALTTIEKQKSPPRPLMLLVPGANFGSSKCWLPERFAQVADRLADPAGFGANVLLVGAPSELAICESIFAACKSKDRVSVLGRLNAGKGISLGALKEIVRRSTLMLCNDTGPRHFAAAFKVPCVTLFGPTDPVWAETFSPCERILRVDVPCGPCQLKKCPIDHRCMKGITVDQVLGAIEELWQVATSRGNRP